MIFFFLISVPQSDLKVELWTQAEIDLNPRSVIFPEQIVQPF